MKRSILTLVGALVVLSLAHAQMTGFMGSSANLIVRDFMQSGSGSDSAIAATAGTVLWNSTPPMQGAFSAACQGGATQGKIAYTPVPTTPTEVWVAFQYQFPVVVNGGNIAEFIAGAAELAEVDMGAAGIINLSRNGGSPGSTVGTMSINTVYYCWWHINTSTGAADFEFQTTKQRQGKGNNFVSIANAGTSGGVNTFEVFSMDTTVGHNNIFDSIQLSNTGYPMFP